MRIGIMCHSSFGGSARIATELAKGLAQRGHIVHLFTRTTPFGDWDATNNVILHSITLSAQDDLHRASLYTDWSVEESEAFLSKIMAVALTDGLDILHFQSSQAETLSPTSDKQKVCLSQQSGYVVLEAPVTHITVERPLLKGGLDGVHFCAIADEP